MVLSKRSTKCAGSLNWGLIAMGLCVVGSGTSAHAETSQTRSKTSPAPHIVFVTGDEEYRSEESMPMLAMTCFVSQWPGYLSLDF